MFSSLAKVLTMLAPMRRPVKEPGLDMKVISEMSCQSLPFSWSFSWIKERSFSARSWPKSCSYSLSSNFRMVSEVLVSRYNFMETL